VTLGEPFTLTAVPDGPPRPPLGPDPSTLHDGGYGLSMMAMMSDSVTHRHGAGVNTVTLVKRCPSERADSGA
jgi:hypothetical protein